jgi:hypothetical protein
MKEGLEALKLAYKTMVSDKAVSTPVSPEPRGTSEPSSPDFDKLFFGNGDEALCG